MAWTRLSSRAETRRQTFKATTHELDRKRTAEARTGNMLATDTPTQHDAAIPDSRWDGVERVQRGRFRPALSAARHQARVEIRAVRNLRERSVQVSAGWLFHSRHSKEGEAPRQIQVLSRFPAYPSRRSHSGTECRTSRSKRTGDSNPDQQWPKRHGGPVCAGRPQPNLYPRRGSSRTAKRCPPVSAQ